MIELVWDTDRQGTGRNASGASLAVGEETHFSPDDLISLAAASCLMKTFLALAGEEGLTLLSYLSTADIVHHEAERTAPHVRIRCYVGVATDQDRRRFESIVARAKSHSPIACLLGDRVDVIVDVRVIEGASPETPA